MFRRLPLFYLVWAGCSTVFGHGALESPMSRVYGCYLSRNASAACAAAVALGGAQAVYDWNGVNIGDAAGRHRERIPDGRLCSAGREQHKGFDLTRPDWPATTMRSDSNATFVFHGTAPHATAYFRFYITRDGYDPSSPLTWAGLDPAPFCEPTWVLENGRFRMTCRVPRKTGRHVIFTIWQRSDSPEAFYSCSDVDFGGGGTPPPSPTWIEIGRIQAAQSLRVGSTVTVRVFDSLGRDVETHARTLQTGETASRDWPFVVATLVNSRSALIRAGEQSQNGAITPIRSATGNAIYASASGYRAAVDIRIPGAPPPPPPPSDVPVYPAGRGSYVAGSFVRGGDGKTYRCRPFPNSGWCNGSDLYYAPGSGLAWSEAWRRVD